MSEPTKELVMKYFDAWQRQDHKEMRNYLAQQVEFNTGIQKFEDADEFTDFFRRLPPWSKVTLLDSIFSSDRAALLYEGVSEFGAKFRMAEFLTIVEGKITHINVVSTSLSQQQ